MSCPCGSSICDCRLECLCAQDKCQCGICCLLPKICSRSDLPFCIIVEQRENVNSICKAENNLSGSHPPSRNSAAYNNTISSMKKTECPRCSLPIVIVTKSKDCHTLDSCCCSHKNSDSNTTGTPPTEHETSNCTSDHRNISGDRQTRKTSRRTRTEKSNKQHKKVTRNHLTNSDEDNNNTEMLASEKFLVEDSRKEDNPELRVLCTESVTSDSNPQNLNFDSNTQSPNGFFSTAGDNSLDNVSLLANTSGFSNPSTSKDFISPPESPGFSQLSQNVRPGFSNPSTSKDFISPPESPGFFQISQNVRPKLPPPFPTLPLTIPGMPAFRNCSDRDSPQQMKTSHSSPPLVNQPALARAEKMEKWFESLQGIQITSGELPDAETAADLEKKGKEKVEQQPQDYRDCQSNSKSTGKHIEPFRNSRNTHSGSMTRPKSAMNNQENGEQLDVTDPTTDTERSSSLSKPRKESESDQ